LRLFVRFKEEGGSYWMVNMLQVCYQCAGRACQGRRARANRSPAASKVGWHCPGSQTPVWEPLPLETVLL